VGEGLVQLGWVGALVCAASRTLFESGRELVGGGRWWGGAACGVHEYTEAEFTKVARVESGWVRLDGRWCGRHHNQVPSNRV
jgi:hypothetical protein